MHASGFGRLCGSPKLTHHRPLQPAVAVASGRERRSMPPRRPTEAEGRVVQLSSAAASSSPTLSEAIRIRLADEITSGHLKPGAEIDEQAVAERFNVSRTPVREALRDLAALGLVEIEPRRGVRVATLTADRLGEMFEVMAETEAMCARLATYRMTAVERLALQALHHQSLEAVERGDIDRYDGYNRDFHAALYRGTHNAFLADHATTLRLRLAPFRRAQFRGRQRLIQSHEEHTALVQQVLRGDGDEVARLMRAHMLTASATFASYLVETAAGKEANNHETPAR
jgi:DNA-binding GntR family transcriptional regulator